MNGDHVTIVLPKSAAQKLRRICNFNVTIGDRVASRDGSENGQAYKSFLYNLGSQLRLAGVTRG